MWLMFLSFSPKIKFLLAAQGIFGIGNGIFSVLLNLYLREIGFPENIIGRLLAVQAMSAAISSVPMGSLADKTSRRTTYLCGLLLLGCGLSCVASTRSLPLLFLAVMLAGSGNGALLVSVQPYLQENSKNKQRPYVFSINYTLTWVTSILSGVIAGWLPKILQTTIATGKSGVADSLQYSLWFGVLFVFSALYPAYFLARKAKTKPSKEKLGKKTAETKNEKPYNPWPIILRFNLCNALVGFGAGMVVPYFNLYFRDWVGSSIQDIGMVFAMGQLGTAIGSLCSPLLNQRIGLVKGVVVSQMLSLPFMIIMAISHNYAVCAVCFIFRSAFMNMSTPMKQEMTMEIIRPDYRARASAMDSMVWNLTWSLAMFFSGGIIKKFGYDFSLAVSFVTYLSSSIIYYLFFAKREKPRA